MTNGVENKIESLRKKLKHIEHGWERKRLEWLEEMKQELEEIDREALELFRPTHPGYEISVALLGW